MNKMKWKKRRSAVQAGLLGWVLLAAVLPAGIATAAPRYTDRFVWIFGWNLGRDSDVANVRQVLEAGAAHGLNGAVASFGLDTLCKKSPAYFRRLDQIKQTCDRLQMDLIPSVFSVGYGGGALAHNPNLAEGLPVKDALFVAHDAEAAFVSDSSVQITNGGFEAFTGNRLKDFRFHDQPGEVSFVDTRIKHSGHAALRLEHFTANPHGHGRVMQEIHVRPYRSYRIGLWVKTEALQPAGAFRVQVLVKNRSLAPRAFDLPATTDWRKLIMIFNSLEFDTVRLYAGLWGGQSGTVWLDDWTIEEIGPVNVLRRPGTPVQVRDETGAVTYREGRDYAPLIDSRLRPYRNEDRASLPLKLLPGGRIREGQRLRVSWYHPMVINRSQVTVCMAEPELYEIYDHEAKLLAEHLHPRRLLLSMDEIRMGGTCAACRGRNLGELLGECITKQVKILRKYLPEIQVYVWSDMLDPNHNAHGDYYLAAGDFSGSWQHVPHDLTIAVWGGKPRAKSLRFFADLNFRTLVACYYDADDLTTVKDWLKLARQTENVRGFMYTPWQKKYRLLPAFADLLKVNQQNKVADGP